MDSFGPHTLCRALVLCHLCRTNVPLLKSTSSIARSLLWKILQLLVQHGHLWEKSAGRGKAKAALQSKLSVESLQNSFCLGNISLVRYKGALLCNIGLMCCKGALYLMILVKDFVADQWASHMLQHFRVVVGSRTVSPLLAIPWRLPSPYVPKHIKQAPISESLWPEHNLLGPHDRICSGNHVDSPSIRLANEKWPLRGICRLLVAFSCRQSLPIAPVASKAARSIVYSAVVAISRV